MLHFFFIPINEKLNGTNWLFTEIKIEQIAIEMSLTCYFSFLYSFNSFLFFSLLLIRYMDIVSTSHYDISRNARSNCVRIMKIKNKKTKTIFLVTSTRILTNNQKQKKIWIKHLMSTYCASIFTLGKIIANT